MYKIYHNPRCRKSRAGLDYLLGKTTDVEIVDYLSKGLTVADVKEIILKSNLKASQLVRTNEDYYKAYLKGKVFEVDEWVRIIVENPKLLQRPFIVSNLRCVLGNPPINIEKLFN